MSTLAYLVLFFILAFFLYCSLYAALGAAQPREILVSIGLIIATTAAVIRLSAKIFQVGILMTGKRLKFREVLRLARSQ